MEELQPSLYLAAQQGNLNMALKFLHQINTHDAFGYLAIHYAARLGNHEVAALLIKNGADVNAVTKGNRTTALMRACMGDHDKIVELLLKNGADRDVTDSRGKKAIDYCVVGKCSIILKPF